MEYQADTQFEQVDPYAPPTKRQRPAVDSRISEQDDVVVLKEKVIIPVDKYPGHNFVGSIIGPSGSILKELTKQTTTSNTNNKQRNTTFKWHINEHKRKTKHNRTHDKQNI